MIKIKELTKRYGENTVYENFGLDIEEGKITCILGESGSGKTTLLNCLAGLTDFVGEVPALKCAYVFQAPRLVPNLTVYKNLYLVCKDEDKIERMLARLRISDKRNCYPASLSGGQAQRVSLARAFLAESDVLLLDEPFTALDLKLKKEINELFLSLQKEFSRTAVFVTHDIGEAIDIADRILYIKAGKIALDIVPTDAEQTRKELIFALVNA